MKLLAIDTSTDYLSLAILDGNKVLSRVFKNAPRSHSSLLMPMIDNILKKAKVKLKDLDGFCISIGPGSFTGLRIGVTAIKGLAFSLDKPIVSVPTMDAIAYNAIKYKGIICVVLDARKGKVYACIYKSDGFAIKRISKYLLISSDELLKKIKKYDVVHLLGDYAERLLPDMPGAIIAAKLWQARPEVVGRLGLEDFKKKSFTSVKALEPLYIYSKECDITGK